MAHYLVGDMKIDVIGIRANAEQGFCKVRLITMSMRIAWACYPRNIGLGIAAQVFVYVGTIILYLCNWFFTQRVVRAQHPRLGWSGPYRIIHRASMVVLIIALLMIVVSSIQQFFTLDETTLHADHYLQLAGFTYFAVFTLAPFILLFVSFVLPRKGTEKFGAGRLRNAIAILFIGSLILAVGQLFRTVIGWLPRIPIRNAQGQPNHVPWYLSTASFYTFNFLTELLVVVFYAVMRVDLRFYVPDGANKPGDYRAWRESQFSINVIGDEKKLKRSSGATGSLRSVTSNETLHEYEASVFEDTHTLADSLRFGSSVMEIDDRTGTWKVKRQSNAGSFRSSVRPSNRSQVSLWDPTRTSVSDHPAPPVPPLPQDWPLRESQIQLARIVTRSQLERHRTSRSLNGSTPLRIVHTPDMEKEEAIDLAARKLEGTTPTTAVAPPEYDFVAPLPPKKTYHTSSSSPGSDIPKKHTYTPSTSTVGSDIPPKKDYRPSPSPTPESPSQTTTSPPSTTGTFTSGTDIPAKKDYAASISPTATTAPAPVIPRRAASSLYSTGNATSIDTEGAEREFARFSFEAAERVGSPDEGASEERKMEG